MLNPNVNPTEELRKLAMSDEEMFTVFVSLGSIAVRAHYLFHPLADFDEYAEMSGKHDQQEVFMELMALVEGCGEIVNGIAERATTINERNAEQEQAEVNRDFFGIMENGFGDDPEPPTE